MSENRLLIFAFVASFGWYAYVLARMLFRRETLVRDGWTKWTWEPASMFPGFYTYGLFMPSLMLLFSAFAIYADWEGWLR
jgi:hypothetical protein